MLMFVVISQTYTEMSLYILYLFVGYSEDGMVLIRVIWMNGCM